MSGNPDINREIDSNTASPVEYLRWLQLRATQQSHAFGSQMSLSASESFRDRDALKAAIEKTSENMLNNLAHVEESELNDWERTLLKRKQDLLDTSVPTGIGNVAYYSALSNLVQDIEQAAARLGYEVPEEVTFGVLPTGLTNGMACSVPAGGLIVAIDDGFFLYLYLLAKTVALFYEVSVNSDGWQVSLVEEDTVKAVRTNEEASQRWIEALVATFIFRYPYMAPQRLLLDQRHLLATELATTVELFIVAHEYGHLILGHLGRDRAISKRQLLNGVEVEGFDIAKEEELEADRIGLELVREYHRNVGRTVEHTRMAVYSWAGCLQVIEDMWGKGPTHPPAATRSMRLLQQLEQEDGISPNASTLATTVYDLIKLLRFHNWTRYEEWRERAQRGEVPWN